jgi:hypothetical protein
MGMPEKIEQIKLTTTFVGFSWHLFGVCYVRRFNLAHPVKSDRHFHLNVEDIYMGLSESGLDLPHFRP